MNFATEKAFLKAMATMSAEAKLEIRELDLSGTQIADAAPLAALVNLESLYLSGTQIADAAPLAALVNCRIYGK